MWHLSAVDRYRNMQIMMHAGPIRQKLSPPLVGRKKNGFVCVSAVSVPLTPGLSRYISDCPKRRNKSPLIIKKKKKTGAALDSFDNLMPEKKCMAMFPR